MLTVRRSSIFSCVLVALVFSASSGRADSLIWQGGQSEDWFVDGNWIGDSHTPAAGDRADIDGGPQAVISGATAAVGQLYVGINGVGQLQVLDPLNSDTAVIGDAAGSNGEVILLGSSTIWTNTGTLSVGNAGTGTLSVQTGAQYSGTGVVQVGAAVGGVGTITVSGTSIFSNAGDIYIGDLGRGSLEITAGGTVETEDAFLGSGAGSAGTVSLSGGGSSWTIDGDLTVGGSGTGTLTISTGAVMTSDSAVVGALTGSDGSAIQISGSGSQWTNSGRLIVGDDGDAVFSIYSGATVSSASTIIGRHSESTVRVAGLGSVFDTGSILIGGDRTNAGSAGDGTLEISGAGKVESQSAVLGDAAESQGTVTVDGAGSRWDVSGHVDVGGLGSGSVTISNSGTIQSASATIGEGAGSSGGVTVTGDGSLWDNAGDFIIGHGSGSSGSTTVSAGGEIRTAGAIIGDLANASGSALVTGSGSTLQVTGDIDVGRFGSGNLDVTLGGSVLADRMLIGDEVSAVGTVTVTGDGSSLKTTGAVYVGDAGDGTLTIAGGGTVTADQVYIATQAGSTGSLIIGSDLGQTAAGRATLNTGAIHFGSGDGTLIFNFGGEAYDLTATIDGDGEIDVASGDVVLSSNSSGFTGTTNISGGSLLVDGRLGGDLSVGGYGILGGSGTVGSTVVNSGGTIAPGNNGVGTLTIDGNVTFNSGSTLAIDLGQSGSDTLQSTGTVVLNGGTLVLSGRAFDPFTTYTILAANGGVSGQFSAVDADYAFLTAVVDSNSNDVTLTLERNGVSFASVGETVNQRSVADGVESLGAGNSLYNAISTLDAAEARDAYQQLAGDMYGSLAAMSFDNSRFVRSVGIDRVRSSFSSVGAAANRAVALKGAPALESSTALAFGETDAKPATAAEIAVASILADPEIEKAVGWGEAYGGWGRLDGDGNASGLTDSAGGLMIGADAPLANSSWRWGAMAGFGRTHFSQSGDHGSGESDDYSIGLYGGNQWGPFGLRLGASYTLQDISTHRSVAFSGFSNSLSANYQAHTAQLYGELAYEVDLHDIKFEPFANLAYVYQRTEGFKESGGAAALERDAADSGVVFTTLGLRASSELSLADVKAIVHGSLGWRHASGDTDTLSSFSFAGGSNFTTIGTAVDRDAVVIEAGIDMPLSEMATIGLVFAGNYASGSSSQVIKAQLQARY